MFAHIVIPHQSTPARRDGEESGLGLMGQRLAQQRLAVSGGAVQEDASHRGTQTLSEVEGEE